MTRYILIALLTGCLNPYDVVLPLDSAGIQDSQTAQRALRELSDEERDLVVGYMIRRALITEDSSRAVTIGEALSAQRRFELDRARRRAAELALTARVHMQEEEAVRTMQESVIVSISRIQSLDRDYSAGRFQPTLEIDVAFQNTTDRDITAIRGVFLFADSFNAPIKQVSLTFEDGVRAGDTVVWHGSMRINEFVREDVRLWSDATSLRATWEPTGVLFSDGALVAVAR
jgi:hypothetical protein